MAQLAAPNGHTPQGRQVSSMADLLNSITSAPQPVVQQAADTATNAVGTLTGGQNQFTQGVNQQATQQLVDPLYDQQDRLQKAFSMYLADPQLAQKYASAAGGGQGSMNPYADPALMASAAANQDTLATTQYQDMQNAGNLAVGGPNMGGLQANTPFTTPVNPYLGDPAAVVDNAANAPQAPSVTNSQLNSTLAGQNQLIDIMNELITSEKGLVADFTKQKSAEYQDKLQALAYWAQTLGQELKDRNDLALKQKGEGEDDAFKKQIMDALGGQTTTSTPGWKRYALLSSEEYAKQAAEVYEKETGEEWAYKQTADGTWEVLRPVAVDQAQGTEGEEAVTVRLVDFETGDEVEVPEDEVFEWNLKGYEEY